MGGTGGTWRRAAVPSPPAAAAAAARSPSGPETGPCSSLPAETPAPHIAVPRTPDLETDRSINFQSYLHLGPNTDSTALLSQLLNIRSFTLTVT